MNIAEPFARRALAAPDRMALVVGKDRLSYGQLYSLVAKWSSALRDMGVRPNHLVMTLVTSRAANVPLALALACIGAKSMGFPPGSRTEAIEKLAQDTLPQFVIHDRDTDFKFDHPGCKGQLRIADIAAADPSDAAFSLAPVNPADIWMVSVSSGTTGTHKGILCSHGASVANANLQRAVFPTTPDDRVLIALDPSSGFATNYWLRALYVGACVHLPSGTPEEKLLAIHRQKISQLITSPANAGAMVQLAMTPGTAYSGPSSDLRILNVGGAAVSPRLRSELRRHICPNLFINYGSTETGLIALLDADLQGSHPDCAGRLAPWVEAQAVDDAGTPLGSGSTGALRFRSPALASGYSNGALAEGSEDPFRDGWFYSSDVGSITPKGLVYLSGRRNDVLNLSGVKVNPQQLEAVMAEDPCVLECAAVTVPGPLDQPMLVAVVVASEGLDEEALKRRCLQRMGLAPSIVVRAGKLPRNEAGKILRDAVQRNVRVTPPR